MSFNGSGTFLINTAGQPVVTNTVISQTAFNALTADLGTGLSTTITKDGQTTTTAKIPFALGLSAAAASNFAAGTVAAPGLYLATDTGTGLYRIGANNYGVAVSGAKVLDISSTGLGVTGTLSATGLISPAQTVGIVGTTTNNSVQAGSVGEYIESDIAPASGVSLTSANPITLTSISLTAGDWDVSGDCQFVSPGPTTIRYTQVSISTTNNTLQNIYKQGMALAFGASILPDTDIATPTPTVRISLASTTTIYLVANASFAVSTLTAAGLLRARRVR
jgi:hypothetical protein